MTGSARPAEPKRTAQASVRPVAALPETVVASEPVAVARRAEPAPSPRPQTPATPRSAPGASKSTASVPAPAGPATNRSPSPPSPAAESPVVRASDRAVEVSIVRTVWHPSPDRRVAHLRVAGQPGNREVHEGDVVDGYVVDEIKLSGVVFAREGVVIERRVGGSR